MIRRALLKISGEAFCPEHGQGLDVGILRNIAKEIKRAFEIGTELVLVVGGGNFIRGATFEGSGIINRANADYMGMLATVMNAIALQDVIEAEGIPVRIQSSLRIEAIAEPLVRRKALAHLAAKRLLVLAGGTGKPFFTTDTCAAQAALELGCEVLFKATKVDGVYNRDPHRDPTATRFEFLTYDQVLAAHTDIRVMDMAAISLCMDHALPIRVFDLRKSGNIERAIRGESIGTLVAHRKSSTV